MILSLRQIKRKIRSIESTKKLTRAMQMVSAAKLNRSQNMLYASRPYYLKLDSILRKLLAGIKTNPAILHPLLEERPEKKKFVLCAVTSDSGLCSTYNDNIIKIAENFIAKFGEKNVTMITVGRKGFNYFKKRGIRISHSYVGLNGRYSGQVGTELAKTLLQAFLSGEADEVYITHTHFDATLKYKPKLQKLLNIEKPQEERELEYILEPSAKRVLEELIPRYISTKVRGILIDAFTAEHSQRMIAMKAATDNAIELIDSLTLVRNKARQASITKEIIEVSSAAEALKG